MRNANLRKSKYANFQFAKFAFRISQRPSSLDIMPLTSSPGSGNCRQMTTHPSVSSEIQFRPPWVSTIDWDDFL